MNKVTIVINCVNESFSDSPDREVAEILAVISDHFLESGKIKEQPLFDHNGNVVGSVKIEQEEKVKVVKAKDVPPGYAFKYADVSCLEMGTQFIKLKNDILKFNVINVATWMPAKVGDNMDVIVLGRVE